MEPSADPSVAGATGRVSVDFGEGKGKVNILANSQIELEPLAGGYRRGDRVRSLIEHEPRNVAKGDTGVVVGPCEDLKASNAAGRVCVDFGEGKGKVNILARAGASGRRVQTGRPCDVADRARAK